MKKIGRNDPCFCGSGIKYKKCCGKTYTAPHSVTDGLEPGVRMKGGVAYAPDKNGFVATVHSWDNAECAGDPNEWLSNDVFPTEDTAMEYYKTYVRPKLENMMKTIERETKTNTTQVKLE